MLSHLIFFLRSLEKDLLSGGSVCEVPIETQISVELWSPE